MAENTPENNQPTLSEVAFKGQDQETRTGSSLAALWLKVNQDDQPPASIPSTRMPLHHCP